MSPWAPFAPPLLVRGWRRAAAVPPQPPGRPGSCPPPAGRPLPREPSARCSPAPAGFPRAAPLPPPPLRGVRARRLPVLRLLGPCPRGFSRPLSGRLPRAPVAGLPPPPRAPWPARAPVACPSRLRVPCSRCGRLPAFFLPASLPSAPGPLCTVAVGARAGGQIAN